MGCTSTEGFGIGVIISAHWGRFYSEARGESPLLSLALRHWRSKVPTTDCHLSVCTTTVTYSQEDHRSCIARKTRSIPRTKSPNIETCNLHGQSFSCLSFIFLRPLTITLLQLFPFPLFIRRLTPEPNSHKRHPAHHCNPNSGDPYPSATDHPTSRPFVMGEMSNSHLFLHINICQKGTFVVDAEGEDAVLVGEGESCAEDGAIGGGRYWLEVEAVERGEHGEF